MAEVKDNGWKPYTLLRDEITDKVVRAELSHLWTTQNDQARRFLVDPVNEDIIGYLNYQTLGGAYGISDVSSDIAELVRGVIDWDRVRTQYGMQPKRETFYLN